jgi:microcystin-dependent protein
MKALHVNFVSGTTTDNPLSDDATTFNSAGLANLPTITADDPPVWIVFNPGAVGDPPEIGLVTVHGAAATSATVTRGQQDTAGTEWASGTVWSVALTADDLEDIYERAAVAGDVKSGVWSAAPTGWLMLDGSTEVDAETNYPDLWAAAPASWQSGADLVLPDMTEDRVLMGGGVLGAEGGANTHTLIEANLPSHTHTIAHTHAIDHDHGSVTSGNNSVGHTHTINHDHATTESGVNTPSHQHIVEYNLITNLSLGGATNVRSIVNSGGSTDIKTRVQDANHTHFTDLANFTGTSGTNSADHTHSVDVAAYVGASGASSAANSGSTGSGTAVSHIMAHLRVNWAIKY